jgi:Uma2 family endonuclease
MGHALEKNSRITYQEYELLEAQAEEIRYEYEAIDNSQYGEVTAMSGAGGIHHAIVQNLTVFFRNHFRPKGCRVYSETMKLEVLSKKKYYYPDVMVACKVNLSDKAVSNPILLVEVLSESTLKRDLGSKLDAYQTIPGLQAYLIVDQAECWVRLYVKEENTWITTPLYTLIEETIEIPALQLQLPVAEIYQDITFA